MATEKQLIEVSVARGYAESLIADPILKMAVNAVLNKTPRVDAVEVVRCGNCKKWFAEDPERCKALSASPFGWCCRNKTICDTDHTDITQHDDFCSYGERKTDNDN